jgi:hypothetical protein
VEILPRRNPDGSASAFLVERYLSAGAVAGLATSVARVGRICADQGSSRAAVRYLQSIYLPADDICFCLFEASSSDAVRAVNEAGHFAFDRISSAVLVIDVPPGGLTPPANAQLTLDQKQ